MAVSDDLLKSLKQYDLFGLVSTPKAQKALVDEIHMAQAIPQWLISGPEAVKTELVSYIDDLKPELQEYYAVLESNGYSEDDVAKLSIQKLIENVSTRMSTFLWLFKGRLKTEMTKNRLRFIFLSMIQGHIQGNPDSMNGILAWLYC